MEHGAKLISQYVAEWEAKLRVGVVAAYMSPEEIEVMEEAMLQYVIEAYLRDQEDDIVETDPSAECAYPKLVFKVDEQMIDVAQPNVMHEFKLRRMEEAYGVLKCLSMRL